MSAIEQEKGHGGNTMVPWSGFVGTDDDVPKLQWPNSLDVYHRMRTDAQIRALLRGVFLPILNFRWSLDPQDARPEVVEWVANDLGLPIKGQEEDQRPSRRRKGRFSWSDHLRHALLKGVYGHMLFEQVYRYDETAELYHVAKWAPRMPRTIAEWKVARDGGLQAVIQHGDGNIGGTSALYGHYSGTPLDVDRLIVYVNEKEGGNWHGQSWLRPCYRHWLRKDRLLRVDALKHERNGMGVPVIEGMEGATPREIEAANQLAQQYKAGEASGGALPKGKLRLVGVDGSLPDTVASMRYDDEQMARAFLEMFIELGQTQTGSRALGDSFIDFFYLSLQAEGQEIADVTTAHGVEDLVDLNWGEDEPAPAVVFEALDDPSLAVEELATLVEQGILVVDDEVEDWVRQRHKLPKRGDNPRPLPTPTPGLEPPGAAAGKGRARRVRAAEGELNLPDRPLRRRPYEHEVMASVDFAEIDRAWDVHVDKIVGDWAEVRAMQIDDLVAQVEDAADDLVALTQVQTEPMGTDIIKERMDAVVVEGAVSAVMEARRQGVEMEIPDLDGLSEALEPRALAVATLLAAGLSQSASRHALLHAGGGLASVAVGSAVREHLESLSEAYLRDQLGAAVTSAQNAGRLAVMEQADGELYASELLDSATCGPCRDKDGTQYDSEDDAREDYPTGGYRGCAGGERCRGTLVKVYDEAEPTVE